MSQKKLLRKAKIDIELRKLGKSLAIPSDTYADPNSNADEANVVDTVVKSNRMGWTDEWSELIWC